MRLCIKILLCCVFLVGCSETKKKQLPQESFFYTPENICKALVSAGIATNTWRPNPAVGNEWFCQSGTIALSPPRGFNPASSMVYRVTGDARSSVFAISFHLKLFSPQDKEEAHNFLKNAITHLFKSIRKPLPKNIFVQMQQETSFTLETPYGIILMNRSGNKPETIEWTLFKRSYITVQQNAHVLNTGMKTPYSS